MLRLFIIILSIGLLASCSFFDISNTKADRYSRCQEIKRQLMFMNATNDERIATQRSSERDVLYRSYRENGCN